MMAQYNHNLPRSGFNFKDNSKLRTIFPELLLFFPIMYLFIGILSTHNNPIIAIYTFAKWAIISNLFMFFLLSKVSSSTSIPLQMEDILLQKKIIKRRMNFTFVLSCIMFFIESIIAVVSYYTDFAHLSQDIEKIYFIPSILEWVLIFLIIGGGLIAAYLGNFIFLRKSAIQKVDTSTGKITLTLHDNPLRNVILLLVPIFIIFALFTLTTFEFASDITQTLYLWVDGIIVLVLYAIFLKCGYQWNKTHHLRILNANNGIQIEPKEDKE